MPEGSCGQAVEAVRVLLVTRKPLIGAGPGVRILQIQVTPERVVELGHEVRGKASDHGAQPLD